MTRALFGRMQIGRCINRDYGYIGCSVDVLPLADRQCSGRPDCSIMVPNSALHETSPCPRDLESYFEADYECIQGMTHMYRDLYLKYFPNCYTLTLLYK